MTLTEGLVSQLILAGSGFVLGALLFAAIGSRRMVRKHQQLLRDSKAQFVGLASHYLLTPITIIQTAVARLQESDASIQPDERLKLYEAIQMGQQRLWIVAEQLVLANEIENNTLRLKISVVDLGDLVTAAIASVDVFARKKNIAIAFHDACAESPQTRVDSRRMRQVLISVIDNAIKFSNEGGKIEVGLSHSAEGFEIEVLDQGIGMNADVQKRIGEKFYRGSGIYNFDYEGLGLGLYSVSAIMAMHQGSISFRSQVNKGTLVTLRFPDL